MDMSFCRLCSALCNNYANYTRMCNCVCMYTYMRVNLLLWKLAPLSDQHFAHEQFTYTKIHVCKFCACVYTQLLKLNDTELLCRFEVT